MKNNPLKGWDAVAEAYATYIAITAIVNILFPELEMEDPCLT